MDYSPDSMMSEEDEAIFNSPIQVIDHSDSLGKGTDSPSGIVLNSGSFRKIVEKDNEDESENDNETRQRLYDMQGNMICEFNTNDDLLMN